MPGPLDPIAVVGMALRLPGGLDHPSRLWEALLSGRCTVSEISGNFAATIRDFDAAFFGMTTDEAERLDPHHWLLLEVGWHALEHAGVRPSHSKAGTCATYVATRTPVYAERVAEVLGLHGPATAVDAPSLAVLDLGRRALLEGECDVALCGSVGEGCSAVVLKRLDDARRDGDRVHALLRGSATHRDVPQATLMRRALAQASLEPKDVSYVETQEFEAIDIVYADEDATAARGHNLRVGSVRHNLEHLATGSGLAGFIKTVLCLEEGLIPPQPAFGVDAPGIDVPASATRWEANGTPRRAAINALGAHVIVEEAATGAATQSAAAVGIAPIVTVSAKSEASLAALRDATEALLHNGNGPSVAASANLDREHFPHRWAHVICPPRGWSPKPSAEFEPQDDVAFMFPGHGSQYPMMGRGLYAREPVFRDAVDRCARVADERLDVPLLRVLFDEAISPKIIDETKYAQPGLFTISYALSCVWQSWGIRPAAVVGHSVGEFAAACISGALTLDEALSLVIERGRLMQELRAPGGMRAVFANAQTVEDWIAPYGDELDIAAINTPTQTVISGTQRAIEDLSAALVAKGTGSKPIRVTQAFHSSLVEPMLESFGATAASAKPAATRCRFFSSVTGREQRGEGLDAGYWCRNSRAPVLFCKAVQTMASAGYRVLMEVGPRSTLSTFSKESLQNHPGAIFVPSSGRPPKPAERMSREGLDLAKAVATLYVHGVNIDWDAVHAGPRGARPELPPYPFDRGRIDGERLSPPLKRTGSRS